MQCASCGDGCMCVWCLKGNKSTVGLLNLTLSLNKWLQPIWSSYRWAHHLHQGTSTSCYCWGRHWVQMCHTLSDKGTFEREYTAINMKVKHHSCQLSYCFRISVSSYIWQIHTYHLPTPRIALFVGPFVRNKICRTIDTCTIHTCMLQDHRYVHHTHMHQSQGSRIIDMCIIHTCIRVKDRGS